MLKVQSRPFIFQPELAHGQKNKQAIIVPYYATVF